MSKNNSPSLNLCLISFRLSFSNAINVNIVDEKYLDDLKVSLFKDFGAHLMKKVFIKQLD